PEGEERQGRWRNRRPGASDQAATGRAKVDVDLRCGARPRRRDQIVIAVTVNVADRQTHTAGKRRRAGKEGDRRAGEVMGLDLRPAVKVDRWPAARVSRDDNLVGRPTVEVGDGHVYATPESGSEWIVSPNQRGGLRVRKQRRTI